MGLDEDVWEKVPWMTDIIASKLEESSPCSNEVSVLNQILFYFFCLFQKWIQSICVKRPSCFWGFCIFSSRLSGCFSRKFLVCDGLSFLSEPITENENRVNVFDVLEIPYHQIETVSEAPDINERARDSPKFLLDKRFEVGEHPVQVTHHISRSIGWKRDEFGGTERSFVSGG